MGTSLSQDERNDLVPTYKKVRASCRLGCQGAAADDTKLIRLDEGIRARSHPLHDLVVDLI